IGDCVMALPAITVLRDALPVAEISVFTGAHSSQVFAGQPLVDTIRRISDQPEPRSSVRLALSLRQYDSILLLDRSRYLRAALALSQVRSRAMVQALQHETRHESQVYLDVVAHAGISVPQDAPLPKLEPIDTARIRSRELIGEAGGPYVVLHPGGAANPGVRMLEKRWPAQQFRELACSLTGLGFRVVLTGGPGDIEVVEAVREGLPGAVSLAGQADLHVTAEVIRCAALYVGGDTGVSHIAGAVGTPVIAIFGPTNPRRYCPLGERVVILAPDASWDIVDRDLRSHTNSASLPSTSEISVEEVLSACERLLQGPAARCSAG
ncbi:MAG: glycosyltransferase family 9 protein, partial [Chloroflexota bacterium]|nr:glycosyltransferase family 9 protein [Chloroflexota bacterium]